MSTISKALIALIAGMIALASVPAGATQILPSGGVCVLKILPTNGCGGVLS